MLFNSLRFILFFAVVTTAYFVIPQRYRWLLLLGVSCYFYMAFVPVYILILFFTITVDYIAGIAIENAAGKRRRWFLILSLIANIGALAFFKYANFVNDNLIALAHLVGWNYPISTLQILLPIGLSFHTFQSMSYTFEVYRGNVKAEKHLGIFALYVMFYPQLVAGPIERPQNLLPQFRVKHEFDYPRIVQGLQLMAWGFFKKLVIADRLALVVNHVYNNYTSYDGVYLLVATLFFGIQIYCDFSGYSDIAIGAAKVMGFTLMRNFNRPFLATSISDFWKRWHISLSTWFRDYLYFPMGGNRVPFLRQAINLMTVFMISGLWHGANWTYVIWGALHGLYSVVAAAGRRLGAALSIPQGQWVARLLMVAQFALVFVLVNVAWVFFRAESLDKAVFILNHIVSSSQWMILQVWEDATIIVLGRYESHIALAAVAVLVGVEILQSRVSLYALVARQRPAVRWALYALVLFVLFVFGKQFDDVPSPFIYFQF